MTAIAGIYSPEKTKLVEEMLKQMTHRGDGWSNITQDNDTVLGMSGMELQEKSLVILREKGIAQDCSASGRFVRVEPSENGIRLIRDRIGIAPLYYGWTNENELCFASEVKGLLPATTDIHELPPGHCFDGEKLQAYYQVADQETVKDPPWKIAKELRSRLERAIQKCFDFGKPGAWLSGGLDSSAIAGIAIKYDKHLNTFAAGLPNSQDLFHARQMADHIHSNHHEVIVQPEDVIKALPDVIYHLESFDALLVRSSIFNYLVAKQTSHFVHTVFSGEGADELFAGYEYLKKIDTNSLSSELVDITKRLHNTALQRVDRCASAHGTIPQVCFLEPEVMEYAFRIPVKFKIYQGVEKWILRQAVADILPAKVLNRPKVKFWQGVGVEGLLTQYAEKQVSTADFQRERILPNGWRLNTKEELLYYRIFNQYFGKVDDLSWMGRTKPAPSTN